MEALRDAVAKEAKAMAEREKAIKARVVAIKEYLRANMERTATRSIECPHFKITLRDNPPKVNVVDPDLLPAEYMRQPEPPPPEPDKRKITEDWKLGVAIDSVEISVGNRVEFR